MGKSRKVGKGKAARTEGQIDFILREIYSALFYVIVPAYIEINCDGTSDEDDELNKRVVYAVGRLLHAGRFSHCPECERILLVGSKSEFPFVHFHELLKELKRLGA